MENEHSMHLVKLRQMSAKARREINPAENLRKYFKVTRWSYKDLYRSLPAAFKISQQDNEAE